LPDLKNRIDKLNSQYDDARRAGDFKVADSIKKQINGLREDSYRVNDSIIHQINENPEGIAEDTQYDESFGQDLNNLDRDSQPSIAQQKERELQQQALGNAPKEEIPGGKAIEVPKSKPTANSGAGKGITSNVTNKVKDAAGAAKQKAGDYLKDKLKKEAMKKIAASLAANPWTWIVVAIILGVIALIILIAIFWGSITGIGKGPSPFGQSFTQAADPLSDKDWIRKVLMMTGDKDVGKMLSNEVLDGLTYDLNTLKSESLDQTSKDKITQVLGLIESFKTSRDEGVGNQIITGIKELENLILNISPFSTGMGAWPIEKNILLADTTYFNRTPHKGTPTYPCSIKGNVCDGHRTYIQFKKDTCDAVDIMVPNGTPVHAAFGGKVTRNDSKAGLRIEATDASINKYTATYAHMTDGKSVGSEVNKDDVIGKVGEGHLHFELATNDRCVVVTPQEYTAIKSHANFGKDCPGIGSKDWCIGTTLWIKMQRILGIN